MNFYSKRGIKLHYFYILLESNAVDIAKVRKRSLQVQPGAPSEPERQEYQITQHNLSRGSDVVVAVIDYLKSFKSLGGVGPLYTIDGENIIIHEKSNIVSFRHVKLHK